MQTAASAPGAAAPRYWSYSAGCSTQDFTGSCWSTTPGGLPGAPPPVAGSDVFLRQAGALALPVAFANPANGRDFSLGVLTIEGTGAGSAALIIGRNTLTTAGTVVGLSGLGRIDQSGGAHIVSGGELLVGCHPGAHGIYNVSGGTLQTVNGFVAVDTGASGSMALSGASTRWTASGGVTLNAGSSLQLAGGGSLTLGRLDASHAIRYDGALTVGSSACHSTAVPPASTVMRC